MNTIREMMSNNRKQNI